MGAHLNGPRQSTDPRARVAPSLFECNDRLEQSLRSRHGGDTWLAEVEAKLHAYRACLHRHVVAAEGDHGWIADLRDDQPRIEPLARRARADFAQLDALVLAAIATLRHPSRAARRVRHDLRQLVELTRSHRGRCARLVHEALAVDLGVG